MLCFSEVVNQWVKGKVEESKTRNNLTGSEQGSVTVGRFAGNEGV